MTQYTHILVAIDFTDSAGTILDKACQIAERNKAKLSLLHIVEYLPPIDSAYEPILASNWSIDETQLLSQAENSLQQLCTQHGLKEANQNVVLGIPKHEITQFVNNHQCDLVVMGSHGRHGISLLLGSTANAVLHEMPCDILAVKIKA